jgi:hypothetical protein
MFNLKTHSAAKSTGEVLDLFSVSRNGENNAKVSKATATIASNTLNNKTIGRWLPKAAERYKISANLEDYVAVPVVIMPSDLPNRNGIAFPLKELTAFNPNPYVKQLGYETWVGSPSFEEHDNEDYTKAKGVVFSSALVKLPNSVGNLYKVVCLVGFDRTKDSELYNLIKSGKRQSYSMGAWCEDYQCSICGKLHSEGTCEHASANNPKFEVFETSKGPKLGYYNAIGICGFEVSSVEDPAYLSAQNEYLIKL